MWQTRSVSISPAKRRLSSFKGHGHFVAMKLRHSKDRITPSTVKSAVKPLSFYYRVLPTMPEPKQGNGWVRGGLCVFHEDRRAGSFFVNIDSGAFNCFACGTKGSDIIAFAQKRRDLSFVEALRWIANEWGVMK